MRIDWGLLIPVGIVILLCVGFALYGVFFAEKPAAKEDTYEHSADLRKKSSKKSPRRREWEERKEKEGNSGG